MAMYHQWNPNMAHPGERNICDNCGARPTSREKAIETDRGWAVITKCRCGNLEKIELLKYSYYKKLY